MSDIGDQPFRRFSRLARQYVLRAPTNLPGPGLCLELAWYGVRFQQTLSWTDLAGTATSLWRSVEGIPTDPWRPSPPLQDLSIETMPDGRQVALLVGMAGVDHWSASIEALPHQAVLVFDIACRTKLPATALGSTYTWVAPSGVGLWAPRHELGIGPWECAQVEARQAKTGLAAIFFPSHDAPTASILQMVGTPTVAIRPQGPPNHSTFRWKYRVELRTPDS